MRAGIAKALNIEQNEQSSVFILIIQSIFIGFFAGSFDVGAQSLFLSVFDASLIPKAFVVSGVVGILITSVYTRLQTRMKFSSFALLNFVFVAVLTALLRFGFEFTNDKKLVFAVFVMMGPLTIISFLGFWGTVGRLFTLRQGKRLFGLIDSGQILGIIIVSFAIPLLISLHFKVLDTLLLCTVSIIIALILQIVITRRFSFQQDQQAEKKDDNFFTLFKSKYTLLMTLFVIFSVVTAFFVHFSFLTVLEENYPDPNALASFLGAFMGTLTIFTIIIKTFVYGKLMKTYGIKLALMISPVLLVIFTVVAAVVGSIYGYTAASASFAFFFLLIVLSKLFAKSLKDSIEVPASKILYQSLDISIRYNVQARIDGTVNELAAFSSGLLLAGLGMLSFVHLIHFSYFLVFVLLIWVFIGSRLYSSYKFSLGKSLEKFQQQSVEVHSETSLLEDIIPGKAESARIAAVLEYAPQSWNGYISKNISTLLGGNEKISSLTLSIIDDLDLRSSIDELEQFSRNASSSQKSRLKIILDRFRAGYGKDDEDQINILLKSEDPEDRKRALNIIVSKNDPRYYPRIVPMFRDPSPGVRISAIHLAGQLKRKDFVTYLIDLLEDPRYYSYAFTALSNMSEEILENLEQGFHKTGITEKGMIRITRVIAGIGTTNAARYLYAKLDHLNKQVFYAAIDGLQKTGQTPGETEKAKLFTVLNRVAAITAWNLTAKYSLKDFEKGKGLSLAIDEEIGENYDMIYSILSVAYDPSSVFHIRKNLESGTSEGIGFAIELLDMFIDENVKPFLFPLLDDTSLAEKVRLLQTEFPVEIMKVQDLLMAIINRDYNQVNSYTRICAIHTLAEIEGYKPGKDLVAQLFNPDKLLREESSLLLYRLDRELFESVMGRLPVNYSRGIRDYINDSVSGGETGIFRRFSYLGENQLFISFKKHQLLSVARKFEIHKFEGNREIPLISMVKNGQMILVAEGEVEFSTGEESARIGKGEFTDPVKLFNTPMEKIVIKNGGPFVYMLLDKSDLRELIFDDEKTYFQITELLITVREH